MEKEEMCESCCCPDDFPKKLGMTAVAIVLVWLLIGGLSANLGWDKKIQTNYITSQPVKDLLYSNGNAKTTVQPDLAQFTVGAEIQKETAKEAQVENAKIMDEVQKNLQKFGISKEKVKTTTFYTQPVTKGEYKCPETKPGCESFEMTYETKIVGYQTVHLIKVETTDLEKVGDMLEAVKDAKQHAEKMAGAVGAKLGKATSISEGYVYTPSYYYEAEKSLGAVMDSVPSTSISSGSLEVSASVSATFEIQ
ncbi:SIMPL domain-containing protein [Candidatus Micrarchaeota archaeon]|nr:SIMPL domain-containing protein [Candidatus Micrarchaeota archaeon]